MIGSSDNLEDESVYDNDGIIIKLFAVSVIAFSRYERTHPNFVSQKPETNIFWTAISPPLG